MSQDRDLVDPQPDPEERSAESALRPTSLAEFEGQPRVHDQLGLVLEAARHRAAVADHVLLSGPPGLGKTTLAMIIAAEMNAPLRISSGPAIQHAGDLAAILSGLVEGEVFFLDEIHRMSRPAEEMLYLAMEDFRVDVVVGKGPGRDRDPAGDPALHPGRRDHPGRAAAGPVARPVRLHRPARLLRHRRARAHRRPFGCADRCRAACPRAAAEIARRSRGTPRIANRLLRRVRDYAQVRADGIVTVDVARAALDLYEVDEIGLDRLDRSVLDAVCRRFGGGPVGLSTLAISVGEETETVEEVAEPFLVREGFLMRTPRGRVATPSAWSHLGLTPPAHAPVLGVVAPGSPPVADPDVPSEGTTEDEPDLFG